MNKDLTCLQPKEVWKHFSEICAIPHPSHHEEKIREYITAFAKAHALEYHVDDAHNIIVRKPATKGMEARKGVIMQAHLDMVPQKNGDKVFDFEKDSIEAYIDGEWVTANGTTLGADNGMGVALILAVLESKVIVHGALEALFTATEETGMDGAFGLKGGVLKGDILLNLDSETEGELYVGCAGGLDANITMKYTQDAAPYTEHRPMKIEIKGLKGGHSGIEIVLQRANANKLLFRFLRIAEKKYDIHLSEVDGGSLRNAIPREASAVMLIPVGRSSEFVADVEAFEKMISTEYKGIEGNISFKTTDAQRPLTVMDNRSENNLINAICACPNGVIKMSTSMHGLVQTSTNLARVVVKEGQVKVQCLLRSSVRSEKEALGEEIASAFELAGSTVELSGSYDGWNPNMESPIMQVMTESYTQLYGKKPAITAIHAGLECGIIGSNYPSLDMISFGPTICFPHSPDEKVNIASVAKFWDFLCHTLGNAPQR